MGCSILFQCLPVYMDIKVLISAIGILVRDTIFARFRLTVLRRFDKELAHKAHFRKYSFGPIICDKLFWQHLPAEFPQELFEDLECILGKFALIICPIRDHGLQFFNVRALVKHNQSTGLQMDQSEDCEDQFWPIELLKAIVEAHQIQNLDCHSIFVVPFSQFKWLSYRLVPIEVLEYLLRLEKLTAKVRCPICDIEVPQSDSQVEPYDKRVRVQFEIQNAQHFFFHKSYFNYRLRDFICS